MHVLAIAQQKGGVGKSTLAIHLAAEATRRGVKAVILELDKQGTSSWWSDKRPTVGSTHDLLKPVEKAKLPPEVIRLDSGQLEQMLPVLTGLGVKLAVVDMPGAHNASVGMAIRFADLVLLPTRPQEVDISASAETLSAVQRLRKPYAYVLTFVEAKGTRAEEARDALEAGGHQVAPQYIKRLQDYSDAVASGLTARELKPKGNATKEIEELWRWVGKKLEVTQHEPEEHSAGGGEQSAETHH